MKPDKDDRRSGRPKNYVETRFSLKYSLALVWLQSVVDVHVVLQILTTDEGLATNGAWVRPQMCWCVNLQFVTPQSARISKALSTIRTLDALSVLPVK